jgi:hypothetical protein
VSRPTAIVAALVLLFLASAAGNAQSRGGSSGHSSAGRQNSTHSHSAAPKQRPAPVPKQHPAPAAHRATHAPSSAPNVARDSHGKIKRSAAAKLAFEKQHPCPATGKAGGSCPGYVVDHVKPLATGGADAPSNMQWQTTAEGKLKDRTERK